MGRRKARTGGRLFGLLLLVAIAFAGAYVYAERTEGTGLAPLPAASGVLRVHYLDVGQGDGTLWELPDGSIVVYDCGPPVGANATNPMVRYLRDTLERPEGSRLAALVASHGHLDHVGGCEEVLAAYDFDHVYEAWYEGDDAPESYRRFQREVLAENTTRHTLADLAPGARLALPSARASLLWPPAFGPGGWDAIAEASLVVRLEHGAASFCFQGDIEERQERQLDGRCDVYLVGHHGSRSASSAGWLARMGPSIAVVSYGENGYGHPTSEALCRIQQAGAAIYATKESGDIVVETDGNEVEVRRGARMTVDACSQGGTAPDASAGAEATMGS